MKNSLFKRISRIVTANVDSILSAVENQNPSAILEQAVIEVEEVMDEVRTELASVLASKHLATKELASKNNQYDGLTEQIQLAVESGKEELAKAGVSEQLDIEAQIPIIEKTILDCQEEEKQLESYILALKAKVNEMNHNVNNLNSVNREKNSVQSAGSGHQQKLEQVEKAFNKVYQNALSQKGSNLSSLEHQSKLQELEKLERENRIQERLHSYKK